jgi:glycosyltransferase involved in cell wall biosynthesis
VTHWPAPGKIVQVSDLAGCQVAILSYRLHGPDGVSVTAAQWEAALRRLGARVRTVAGEGRVDVVLPGLALNAGTAPTRRELASVLDGADLVIVDNVCSLPVNRRVGEVLADYLAGRWAVLRHHDLPWERPQFADITCWPPDDPAWLHVTINELARRSLLARRGISATTVYHGFDERPCPELRRSVRARLSPAEGPLVLQPTRAIPRKNVAGGLALATGLAGTFWLTGPTEDGYADELRDLLAGASVPVRRGLPPGVDVAAAYAACDVVVLPSTWEGFGLPLIESALHRRPMVVADFPVARELAAFGFRWFDISDLRPLHQWLREPDPEVLDANERIARRHFSLDALARRLAQLLGSPRLCHHSATDRDEGVSACGSLTA